MAHSSFDWRALFRRGTVIPAHPLALTPGRKLDERRQRALTRYYLATGAGGIAVGVHTTQFEIRDPGVGLFEPVLANEGIALEVEEYIAVGWLGQAGQSETRLNCQQLEFPGTRSAGLDDDPRLLSDADIGIR